MSRFNTSGSQRRNNIHWLDPTFDEDYVWIEKKSQVNGGPLGTSELRATLLEKNLIAALNQGPDSFIAHVKARLDEEIEFLNSEDYPPNEYWEKRYEAICESLEKLGAYFIADYSNLEASLPAYREFIPKSIFEAYLDLVSQATTAKEKASSISQVPSKAQEKSKQNSEIPTRDTYVLSLKVEESAEDWILLHSKEETFLNAISSYLSTIKQIGIANEYLYRYILTTLETIAKQAHLYLACNSNVINQQKTPFLSDQFLDLYREVKSYYQHLRDQYESFPWPSTDAPLGNGDSGADWTEKVPKVGMLKHMGYKVGEQGLGQEDRRKILREVFKSPLPLVKSREYTAQWGNPNSSQRLQKLAKTLASLCRQFKRNDASGWADYTCAIEEYEDDLDWLYHTYYKGRFDFPWPETYQEDYD